MARSATFLAALAVTSAAVQALPQEVLKLRQELNVTEVKTSFTFDNVPPVDYVPFLPGIPYTIENTSAQPWDHLDTAPQTVKTNSFIAATACGGPTPGTSKYWYESITHNGQSSFMNSGYKANYKVWRNVVADFGADNTGSRDASAAIQQAIATGASNGPRRDANQMGTTGQPAVVYLPSGTYLMQGSLQLYAGTVLVGNPLNPPVLKAAPGFANDHIIYAKDPNLVGTVNFYIGMKNIIIDSTGVDKDKKLALVDWTVSQATQLTNVVFNMPNYSSGHTGLTTQYDSNSNIIMNDLIFNGGVVGMQISGQQWALKNLTFSGTTTGIVAGAFDLVVMGMSFQYGDTGIDSNGVSGSLTVLDSSGHDLGQFINGPNSGNDNARSSIVLGNIQNSGNTVKLSGNVVLTGSVTDTWIHGNYYAPGSANKQYHNALSLSTARTPAVLLGNQYFTAPPPTYKEYDVSQFINIKSVPNLPVFGDGSTDDTANINAILQQAAGCKIVYFPAGTYMVTDTIHIPADSRIIGDAFGSAISATGSKFKDANAPRAMVQLGAAGDVGVGQISDLVFTVADILPGCKLVEVNIAGANKGDVGFWNSHFRVGGAAGSKVRGGSCNGSPWDCKAAWGLIHLTSTSSAYIENMWGWTADHDLDDGSMTGLVIATGRGMLIEATKGTWLIGTGMEHNTLYQYNFESASNVFAAMQQTETAYWQGPGNVLAPEPWAANLLPSDPIFSECASDDAQCRMGWFERIQRSSNLFLYGGCVWTFFNNRQGCNNCQQNAIRILNPAGGIYLYGTNTKGVSNMVKELNTVTAPAGNNQGGWGGVIAAYLYDK